MKILQTCYSAYFGQHWLVGNSCRKCLSGNKKPTGSLRFFYRYYTYILGNNSRTRILPDMGFAIKSQELKELSFYIVFRKNRRQKFSKKCKIPHFWAIFAQIWVKLNFFTKFELSLFSIYIPLTSCKNQKKHYWANSDKNSELTDERTNGQMDEQTNTHKIIGPIRSNRRSKNPQWKRQMCSKFTKKIC